MKAAPQRACQAERPSARMSPTATWHNHWGGPWQKAKTPVPVTCAKCAPHAPRTKTRGACATGLEHPGTQPALIRAPKTRVACATGLKCPGTQPALKHAPCAPRALGLCYWTRTSRHPACAKTHPLCPQNPKLKRKHIKINSKCEITHILTAISH